MPQLIAKSVIGLLLAIGCSCVDAKETLNAQSSAEKRFESAFAWERQGRFQMALTTYQELLETSLTKEWRDELLFRQARLRYQLAQYRVAREILQQYVDEFPAGNHAPEALAILAWTHLALGQPSHAGKNFQELHAKFPQSPQAAEAAYWLACATAEEGNSAAAVKYVDWLLAVLSEPATGDESRQRLIKRRALCLKCQLAAEAGQWQVIKALVASHAKQLQESNERTCLLFWWSEAEFRTKNFDTARMQLEDLEALIIGIDEAWVGMVPLRLAQLAARRQQWSKVLKILKDFEDRFPAFALQYEVDYLRGRAWAGKGEMTPARNSYQRVLERLEAAQTETAARSEWMIGETFFHQRDYPRAREVYLKVMQRKGHPEWQARAALQAGKCWELQESWQQASTVYKTALEQWQNSESASLLEARLDWTEKQLTRK